MSIDNQVGMIANLCGMSGVSPEADQLRALLLQKPGIRTMTDLRNYLSSQDRAGEHRTSELDTIVRNRPLTEGVDRLLNQGEG